MQEFLKIVSPLISNFAFVSITGIHVYKDELLKIILKAQKDETQYLSRLRFEGETSFLNDFYNKVLGFIAVQSYLKDKLIDIKSVTLQFVPLINYLGKDVIVNTANFGSFHEVDKNSNFDQILVFNKDNQHFWIAGIAERKVVKKYACEKGIYKNKNTYLREFKTYDKLVPIKNG